MKRLIELLRSERPLLAGAFSRLAGTVGLDRALVRIAGFIILWIAPYLLGAPYRTGWLFSILGYVALVLFFRRRDRCGSRRDEGLIRRCRQNDQTFHRSGDFNGTANAPQPTGNYSMPPQNPAAPTPPQSSSGPVKTEDLTEVLSKVEERLIRLDQRIQKMETVVTDRAFDWDRRLRKG